MTLLSIKNVKRKFPDNNGSLNLVLDNINLNIQKGEFISLIGPSGCGKTTLLRLISGLDQPQDGKITVNNKRITHPDVSRGYVFQHMSLFPWATIEENIASGLKATNKYDANLVHHYISLMGLDGFEQSYPNQVSGGMAQRAALARSIIMKPELLLLDEPLGALDAFTRADIQNVITRIWEKTHITMILVTHDIDESIYLSDKIAVMTPLPGKIKDIVNNPLKRPRQRNSDEFLSFRQKVQDELSFAIK